MEMGQYFPWLPYTYYTDFETFDCLYIGISAKSNDGRVLKKI